jgi:ABC-type sugar transport system ATPase subunit
MQPKVLLLDDPTRGVDIGAKSEIYRILRALADAGAAILFTSSDSLELARLSDRIILFRHGAIVEEISHNISHSALDRAIAAA